MRVSIVIPTLNRPNDLVNAVRSISVQSYKPSQLVVIDQSSEALARFEVEEICNLSQITLNYIITNDIKNLPAAKQRSLDYVSGDIVCFLDDDVELEPEYIFWQIKTFMENDNIMGCCGIEANPFPRSSFYYFVFHLFHKGIFADERMGVLKRSTFLKLDLVYTDKVSGGFSAWRKEVFNNLPFDETNNLHVIEDIDFSSRVARFYGGSKVLCICKKAQAWHHYSDDGRLELPDKNQRKIREFVLYFRMRKNWSNAYLSFTWLLVGFLVETILLSIKFTSMKIFISYWKGIFAGFRHEIKPRKSSKVTQ